MDKFFDVLKSQNFLVTIYTIITSIFAYNQVTLTVDPADISASFNDSSTDAIITTAILLFLNPTIKIIRSIGENGFNTGFLKSSNFWVQVGSAILLVAGTYFDPEILKAILATIVANTGNLAYHSLKPVKIKNV